MSEEFKKKNLTKKPCREVSIKPRAKGLIYYLRLDCQWFYLVGTSSKHHKEMSRDQLKRFKSKLPSFVTRFHASISASTLPPALSSYIKLTPDHTRWKWRYKSWESSIGSDACLTHKICWTSPRAILPLICGFQKSVWQVKK